MGQLTTGGRGGELVVGVGRAGGCSPPAITSPGYSVNLSDPAQLANRTAVQIPSFAYR